MAEWPENKSRPTPSPQKPASSNDRRAAAKAAKDRRDREKAEAIERRRKIGEQRRLRQVQAKFRRKHPAVRQLYDDYYLQMDPENSFDMLEVLNNWRDKSIEPSGGWNWMWKLDLTKSGHLATAMS